MRFLLAVAAVALLTAAALAAPDKTKPAPPDDAADIADKLLDRVDLDRFEQTTVRTALEMLQEKLGYTILVDHKAVLAAMGQDGANRQALDEQVITLPAMKRVRLETALRQVLDQIQADFYIEADHVQVTSPARKDLVIGPRRVLPELRPVGDEADAVQPEAAIQIRHTPTVTVNFKDTPLEDAVKAVSLRTGRAIAINPEAAERGKAPVTLALANAPFETAVSVLAEAAGLRAFRTGNAAVLVTPERARRIEEPGMATGGPLPESRLTTPELKR